MPAGKSTLSFRGFRGQRNVRIRLIASTDAAGSADANLRLARRRGEAVKAALVRRGVPAGAIDIDARGEAGRFALSLNSERNEDHRVVEVQMVAAPAGCWGSVVNPLIIQG